MSCGGDGEGRLGRICALNGRGLYNLGAGKSSGG
nr:MAG TPA: hypothetical protein [Caudoviricetes sp.]